MPRPGFGRWRCGGRGTAPSGTLLAASCRTGNLSVFDYGIPIDEERVAISLPKLSPHVRTSFELRWVLDFNQVWSRTGSRNLWDTLAPTVADAGYRYPTGSLLQNRTARYDHIYLHKA